MKELKKKGAKAKSKLSNIEISKQDYITGALGIGLSAVVAAQLYKKYTRAQREIKATIQENDTPDEKRIKEFRRVFNDMGIDAYKNVLVVNVKFLYTSYSFGLIIVFKKSIPMGVCIRNIMTKKINVHRPIDYFLGNERKVDFKLRNLRINTNMTVDSDFHIDYTKANVEKGVLYNMGRRITSMFSFSGKEEPLLGDLILSMSLESVTLGKTMSFDKANVTANVIMSKEGGEIEITYPSNIKKQEKKELTIKITKTEDGEYVARCGDSENTMNVVEVNIPFSMNGMEIKCAYKST